MTSPIRVAHVIGSTGVYGAEQWILALLRYLPRDRVEGTLVNLVDERRRTSAVVQAARARGIHAVDLHTGGRFNPLAIMSLARICREHGYRVLHSHGHKADATTLFAAKLSRARAVSTLHGWSREDDKRLKLYEALDRQVLPFFDTLCPLSPDLRDGLRRSGVRDEKVRMILNGVDVEAVDSVLPAAERRPGGTVVGYVGQLIGRKNVECLIRAFDRLSEQGNDLRLKIVGDGLRANELRELARRSTRVDFTGYRADAVAIMKSFDLFVLPSWEEGIPRSLMEAMAAGVPVIASDIPGNRELVEHEVTGLRFRPDSPDELSQAILAMIERPERAKDMARRARATVEARFSARRMAEDYAALYEAC